MSGVEIRVRSNSTQARQDLNKLERSVGNIEKTTANVTKAFVGLAASISAAFAITGISRGINRTTDSLTSLENRIALVTGRTKELNSTLDSLYKIAKNTNAPVDLAADTFNRFGLTLKKSKREVDSFGLSFLQARVDTGRSTDDILKAVTSINKAVAISGSSTESARAALIQFGQGIASGALRGEELNSVLEQTPRIAQAIEDSLGISRKELREMAKEGKITSDVAFNALLSQAEKLDQEFSNLNQTSAQAFTVLGDQAGRLTAEISKQLGITSSFVSKINRLTNFIEDNRTTIVAKVVEQTKSISETFKGLLIVGRGVVDLIKVSFSRLKDAIPAVITPMLTLTDIIELKFTKALLKLNQYISNFNLDLKAMFQSVADTKFASAIRSIFKSESLANFGKNLSELANTLDRYGRRWYNFGNQTERFFRKTKVALIEFGVTLGILDQRFISLKYDSFERIAKLATVIKNIFKEIIENLSATDLAVNLKVTFKFLQLLLNRIGRAIENISESITGLKISEFFKIIASSAESSISKAWKTVNKYLKLIERKFFWVYDKVIGNSWWTDTMTQTYTLSDSWLTKTESRVIKFAKRVGTYYQDLYTKVSNLSRKVLDVIQDSATFKELKSIKLDFSAKGFNKNLNSLKRGISKLKEDFDNILREPLNNLISSISSQFNKLSSSIKAAISVAITGGFIAAVAPSSIAKFAYALRLATIAAILAGVKYAFGDIVIDSKFFRSLGEGLGTAAGTFIQQIISSIPFIFKALIQGLTGFGDALSKEIGGVIGFALSAVNFIPGGGLLIGLFFGTLGVAAFSSTVRSGLIKAANSALGTWRTAAFGSPLFRQPNLIERLIFGATGTAKFALGRLVGGVFLINSIISSIFQGNISDAILSGGLLALTMFGAGGSPAGLLSQLRSVSSSILGLSIFSGIRSLILAATLSISIYISSVRIALTGLVTNFATSHGLLTRIATAAYNTIAAVATSKLGKVARLVLLISTLSTGLAVASSTGTEGILNNFNLLEVGILATLSLLGTGIFTWIGGIIAAAVAFIAGLPALVIAGIAAAILLALAVFTDIPEKIFKAIFGKDFKEKLKGYGAYFLQWLGLLDKSVVTTKEGMLGTFKDLEKSLASKGIKVNLSSEIRSTSFAGKSNKELFKLESLTGDLIRLNDKANYEISRYGSVTNETLSSIEKVNKDILAEARKNPQSVGETLAPTGEIVSKALKDSLGFFGDIGASISSKFNELIGREQNINTGSQAIKTLANDITEQKLFESEAGRFAAANRFMNLNAQGILPPELERLTPIMQALVNSQGRISIDLQDAISDTKLQTNGFLGFFKTLNTDQLPAALITALQNNTLNVAIDEASLKRIELSSTAARLSQELDLSIDPAVISKLTLPDLTQLVTKLNIANQKNLEATSGPQAEPNFDPTRQKDLIRQSRFLTTGVSTEALSKVESAKKDVQDFFNLVNLKVTEFPVNVATSLSEINEQLAEVGINAVAISPVSEKESIVLIANLNKLLEIKKSIAEVDADTIRSDEENTKIKNSLLQEQEAALKNLAKIVEIANVKTRDLTDPVSLLRSAIDSSGKNIDFNKVLQIDQDTLDKIVFAQLNVELLRIQLDNIGNSSRNNPSLLKDLGIELANAQAALAKLLAGLPLIGATDNRTALEKFSDQLNGAGFSSSVEFAANLSRKAIESLKAPLSEIEALQKKINKSALTEVSLRKSSSDRIKSLREEIFKVFEGGTVSQASVGLEALGIDPETALSGNASSYELQKQIADTQERLNNTLFTDYETRKAITQQLELQKTELEGITEGAEASSEAVKSSLSSSLKDALTGAKSVKEALFSVLDSISNRIIDTVVNSFVDAFYEVSGLDTLFKDLFAGLFKGADSAGKKVGEAITKNIGDVAVDAEGSGGIAKFFSGFGESFKGVLSGIFGSGGFFSTIFSSIGSIFGIGGGVTPAVTGMAVGGIVTGGIRGVDSVPTMLTPGELVVPEKNIDDFMNGVNNNNKTQQVINLNITGDISRQTKSEIIKMLPTIATGVSAVNKERGLRA